MTERNNRTAARRRAGAGGVVPRPAAGFLVCSGWSVQNCPKSERTERGLGWVAPPVTSPGQIRSPLNGAVRCAVCLVSGLFWTDTPTGGAGLHGMDGGRKRLQVLRYGMSHVFFFFFEHACLMSCSNTTCVLEYIVQAKYRQIMYNSTSI
jgi:hypothetical protein